MPSYPSPFEFLITFAVIFAAGMLTSVCMRRYANKIRMEAAAHA